MRILLLIFLIAGIANAATRQASVIIVPQVPTPIFKPALHTLPEECNEDEPNQDVPLCIYLDDEEYDYFMRNGTMSTLAERAISSFVKMTAERRHIPVFSIRCESKMASQRSAGIGICQHRADAELEGIQHRGRGYHAGKVSCQRTVVGRQKCGHVCAQQGIVEIQQQRVRHWPPAKDGRMAAFTA